MNAIRELTPLITQIKVPLPFPLRWVNSYVIKGSDGYTILDPGLHTEAAEQLWMGSLRELRIAPRDIEQIVLTHYHPDHYGIAGWFQALADAPVFMSETGAEHARSLWGQDETMSLRLAGLYLRHGMDRETAAQITPHMTSFYPLVSPQPVISLLPVEQTAGQGSEVSATRWRLGDREYTLIPTAGHAAGHISFYDEEGQAIFCGDHVLPRISPNVSYMPGSDENPLKSFLHGLRKLAGLPVTMAYPGHREPFAAFKARAEELQMHHGERLNKIVELLETPQNDYEICLGLFGKLTSIHQLRFAMSETIAHTVYLAAEGKIEAIEQEEMKTYRRKDR